jgi:hypothetical protein
VTSVTALRQLGFVPAGQMTLKKDGIGYVGAPATMKDAVAGLYAFVLDEGEILYLGSSTDLAYRIYMDGFSFAAPTHNLGPAHKKLRPLVEAARPIGVWVCINPTKRDLVHRLQPSWNSPHEPKPPRKSRAAASCFAE